MKVGTRSGRRSAARRGRQAGDRRRDAVRRCQRRLSRQAGAASSPTISRDQDVGWFEEPVSSDDLPGLRAIAAARSGRHGDRGRRICLHRGLCPRHAGGAGRRRAAGRHDPLRRRDRLSADRRAVRGVSRRPVRRIARRRCICTSPARRRGCGIWNGFTTTSGSSTCCSTAPRCRKTAIIRPDLSRPGHRPAFQAAGCGALCRLIGCRDDADDTANAKFGRAPASRWRVWRCGSGAARAPRLSYRRTRRGVAAVASGRSPAEASRHRYAPRGASIAPPARWPRRFSPTARVEHYRGSFKNKAMFTPLIVSALDAGRQRARHLRHRGRGRTGCGTRSMRWRLRPDSSAPDFTSTTSARRPAASAGRICSMARRSARRWRCCCRASSDFARSGCARASRGRDPRYSGCRRAARWRRSDRRGIARHDRRSRAAAFPRRLPQPVHVAAGDAAAARRRAAGDRPRSASPAAIAGSPAGGCVCWRRWGSPASDFHAYGVSRNMGGWRNWSQNVLNGPPLPAPPSFTGPGARRPGGARPDGGPPRCLTEKLR